MAQGGPWGPMAIETIAPGVPNSCKGGRHACSQLLVELAPVRGILEGLLDGDLAGVFDYARLLRRRAVLRLHLPNKLHALEDGAEHDMPAVQVRSRDRRDEERAAVRVPH